MRKIAEHFQDWFVLRGLNITKIARLGSVGEDVQESAGVGPQLCLTDQVSSQIERRKLLLEPFLEDLISFREKDFRNRSGHCSGVELIRLTSSNCF